MVKRLLGNEAVCLTEENHLVSGVGGGGQHHHFAAGEKWDKRGALTNHLARYIA